MSDLHRPQALIDQGPLQVPFLSATCSYRPSYSEFVLTLLHANCFWHDECGYTSSCWWVSWVSFFSSGSTSWWWWMALTSHFELLVLEDPNSTLSSCESTLSIPILHSRFEFPPNSGIHPHKGHSSLNLFSCGGCKSYVWLQKQHIYFFVFLVWCLPQSFARDLLAIHVLCPWHLGPGWVNLSAGVERLIDRQSEELDSGWNTWMGAQKYQIKWLCCQSCGSPDLWGFRLMFSLIFLSNESHRSVDDFQQSELQLAPSGSFFSAGVGLNHHVSSQS